MNESVQAVVELVPTVKKPNIFKRYWAWTKRDVSPGFQKSLNTMFYCAGRAGAFTKHKRKELTGKGQKWNFGDTIWYWSRGFDEGLRILKKQRQQVTAPSPYTFE